MTRKHAKFLPLAVAATVAAALQIYPAGVFSGLELATSTAYAAAEHSEFPPAGDWRTISDDALGFKIDYPGNIFHRVERDDAVSGHVLLSDDGQARLMIAAFDNDLDSSLRDYRKHVLQSSYAGSDIDYAPVRRSWFVLSGTREGTEFYERVSFTCSNSRITSWAMLYPYAQRNYYNRVLEQIPRTFRPSRVC